MADRKLRDITSNHVGEPDLDYLQRKIAAAGEMKTAIKKFLDKCEEDAACPVCTDPSFDKLRKAMEDYLNCTPSPNGESSSSSSP